MRSLKATHGFTLIELLVVIAIIGLLSTIVVASLSSVRENARLAGAKHAASTFDHDIGSEAVGWWDFNECSGATTLNSADRTNSLLVGSPLWSADTPTGAGCSISFNGSSQVIQATVPGARTNVISVVAWIKPVSTMTSRQDFFSSGSAATYASNNWIFSIKGNYGVNGGLSVLGYSPSGTSDIWTATPVLSTNKWSFVAFVSDGSNTVIYVDGIAVKKGPLVLNAGNTTGEFIGGSSGTSPLNGIMDNARIYASSLTVSQIQKLYALGKPAHSDEMAINK